MKKKILFVLDLIIILIIYGLLYLLIAWIESHNMPGLMTGTDVKKILLCLFIAILLFVFFTIYLLKENKDKDK
ncbi:MAG: hypothetical protein K2K06_11080 [Oscillospiraceae bacterium]|nr:hypothetical protein [Oscillospiraceae bacterium]